MKKKLVSLGLASALVWGAFSGIAGAEELTPLQKYQKLVEAGIFDGVDETGNAALDWEMSRAQLAKIISLIAGLDTGSSAFTSSFTDVTSDNWAFGMIQAVSQAGLMIGNGDGTFNPNGDVTFEQLAAVLVRTLDLQTDSSATIDGVSDWAQGYVNAAVQAGLIDSGVDYRSSAVREQIVSSTYGAGQLKTDIETAKEENKQSIGKLLALGVMSAEDGQFGASETMSKDDVLQALGAMTNDKLDAAALNLPDNPTFADILRAYLLALGYPADSLQDASGLVEKAVAAGIVGEDSPLLKIQQLNLPLSREWGSYLTAGTLFNASVVTVQADGSIKLDDTKHLSQTMKLPSAPIKVELKDMEGVPTFDSLGSIDPVIEQRVTTAASPVVPVIADTYAPVITAAAVNGMPVEITNGTSGSISVASDVYLTSGTITTNEDAKLTITGVEGIDLSGYSSSLSLTQELTGGAASSLNLIDFLDGLDSEHDGISVNYLLRFNPSEMTIAGILEDRAGNKSNVSLTFHWLLQD